MSWDRMLGELTKTNSLNTSVLSFENGLMISLTRVVAETKCDCVCEGWYLLDILITTTA